MAKKRSIKLSQYIRNNQNDLVDRHFVYSNVKFNDQENHYEVKLKFFHTRKKIENIDDLDYVIEPKHLTNVGGKDIFIIEAEFDKGHDDPGNGQPINIGKLSVLEIDLKISPKFSRINDHRIHYQIIQKDSPYHYSNGLFFDKSSGNPIEVENDKKSMIIITSDCDIIIPPPPPPRIS